MQWLAEEIKEMSGDSYLFEGDSVGFKKDEELMDKLNQNVNSLYKDLQSDIDNISLKNSDELKQMYARFKDIKNKDFFNSSLGEDIFKKLKKLELKLKSEGLI